MAKGTSKLLFSFADCILDTERRELRRGDTLIALPPKVFDLLVYLIQNRDRVVSKDDLIETVWNGRLVSESALATRINAVRQAIGDTGAEQRLIKTVQRKGIRFVGAVHESERRKTSASALAQSSPASNKPSLAVLAFQNMSGDPEQEYFADGIAEDLITALSRSQSLFVIARNSSFIYKSRAVDVKQIGSELGVRYVLEGSVRREGKHVRITAQLVDAATRSHLWADRYDRELVDLFAVQDEIATAVATAIEPTLVQFERHRAIRKPTDNLDAWEAYQRGLWHMGRIGAAYNEAAKTFLRRAIDLDPNFASAHAELAQAMFHGAHYQGTLTSEATLDEALPFAEKSIALDPLCVAGYIAIAAARTVQGDNEGVLVAARQALAISPNYASAHHFLGTALVLSGRPREGLDSIHKAIRLDPYDPLQSARLYQLAMAHYFLREYEAAAGAARDAVRSYPDHPHGYRWLAASLGQSGNLGEARRALEKAIAVAPDAFNMYVRQRVPWMRVEDYGHMVEGLRKAGWDG